MIEITLVHYLFLSAIIFTLGVFGIFVNRKNVIVILMSIELMLNSVNLLLVAFATFFNDGKGQVFVFFVMLVAAAEVSIGLAIIMMIYRNTKSVDIDFLKKLKW